MGAIAIREKLHEYIRNADDKKVKAIFTVIEKEIEDKYNWWQDEKLISVLDKEYAAFESGRSKGYTIEDIKKNIEGYKKKKLGTK